MYSVSPGEAADVGKVGPAEMGRGRRARMGHGCDGLWKEVGWAKDVGNVG